MSAADAASLSSWSWWYSFGAYLVIAGVALEGADIIARHLAKRKQRRFIGPVKDSPIEPQTPTWAHTVGDVGFVILVGALLLEQICHHRMEDITDRERDRNEQVRVKLEKQIEEQRGENAKLFTIGEKAKESAALATKAAEEAKKKREVAEAGRLELQFKVFQLEVKTAPRIITPEMAEIFAKMTATAPKGRVIVYKIGDVAAEGAEHAARIFELLKNCGYEVGKVPAFAWGGPTAVGVWLAVADLKNPPPITESLHAAMKAAHLIQPSMKIQSEPLFEKEPDAVFVVVGVKN